MSGETCKVSHTLTTKRFRVNPDEAPLRHPQFGRPPPKLDSPIWSRDGSKSHRSPSAGRRAPVVPRIEIISIYDQPTGEGTGAPQHRWLIDRSKFFRSVIPGGKRWMQRLLSPGIPKGRKVKIFTVGRGRVGSLPQEGFTDHGTTKIGSVINCWLITTNF